MSVIHTQTKLDKLCLRARGPLLNLEGALKDLHVHVQAAVLAAQLCVMLVVLDVMVPEDFCQTKVAANVDADDGLCVNRVLSIVADSDSGFVFLRPQVFGFRFERNIVDFQLRGQASVEQLWKIRCVWRQVKEVFFEQVKIAKEIAWHRWDHQPVVSFHDVHADVINSGHSESLPSPSAILPGAHINAWNLHLCNGVLRKIVQPQSVRPCRFEVPVTITQQMWQNQTAKLIILLLLVPVLFINLEKQLLLEPIVS